MNGKKYLIVECNELGDQWECDADRKPITMVGDISFWKQLIGYEIYELKANGTFEIIKYYEEGELYVQEDNRGTLYIAYNSNNAFHSKWAGWDSLIKSVDKH